MKIKEIYCINSKNYVSTLIAITCIAITIITRLLPNTYHVFTYAYPIQYPWQIFSGIFVHGSPEMSLGGTIGHLFFNLLLVLTFGIMIEKIIGTKRFAFLSLAFWIVNIVVFYTIAFVITPKGEIIHGAGISGIAFSYGTIGFYVLVQLFKHNRRLLLRQVSFYVLISVVLVMFIMINPFVAGISSMLIHLIAVVAGIVSLLIDHKRIDVFLAAKQLSKNE